MQSATQVLKHQQSCLRRARAGRNAPRATFGILKVSCLLHKDIHAFVCAKKNQSTKSETMFFPPRVPSICFLIVHMDIVNGFAPPW